MDTPDFNHLAHITIWGRERWIEAWDIVTEHFRPDQVEPVWTAVRNLTDRLGGSPNSYAAAIVHASA